MKYAGQDKVLGAESSAAVFWFGKSYTFYKILRFSSYCIRNK